MYLMRFSSLLIFPLVAALGQSPAETTPAVQASGLKETSPPNDSNPSAEAAIPKDSSLNLPTSLKEAPFSSALPAGPPAEQPSMLNAPPAEKSSANDNAMSPPRKEIFLWKKKIRELAYQIQLTTTTLLQTVDESPKQYHRSRPPNQALLSPT
eukprot:Gregarina_sp_Poly_1__10668@NODE_803_length_6231_cov_277_802239_g586_i0_p5_GENE_NODE_803_length_6231_cov_277_802239_g586_i0NODE_803_length_6231_cov_277_802239_g586_i0_p5_ORF_typecomplete_len153_score28_42_NODE_803_length_6231_cov_277_802239_g586_i030073465